MAVEALVISQFVAAGAMLLLAGWLLWLNFRSPVNRSFALFLFFRAMVIVANRMRAIARADGNAELAVFWESIREYYLLALVPTLVYFWLTYSGRRKPWLGGMVLLGGIALELLYLQDHCLDYCARGAGGHVGPIAWLAPSGYVLAGGLVGLAILVDALRGGDTPRSLAAFPVAVGLLLNSLLEASLAAGFFVKVGPAVVFEFYDSFLWPRVLYATFFLGGIVLPAIGLILVGHAAMNDARLWAKVRFYATLAVLIGTSGFYVGFGVVTLGEEWLPGIFLQGLWRILLPTLVAYALVRHRLFGVEVRLKWTLVRATMAFTFLAVFFVGAQLAQNYLSTAYGWGLGGVAAGLLLFAISPIQRMAEHFTQTVMPHSKPVTAMTSPERLDLFRHQAVLVWADGSLGRKERALLDSLRNRLGIPLEDAVRIEAEAATLPTAPGASRAHSTHP